MSYMALVQEKHDNDYFRVVFSSFVAGWDRVRRIKTSLASYYCSTVSPLSGIPTVQTRLPKSPWATQLIGWPR